MYATCVLIRCIPAVTIPAGCSYVQRAVRLKEAASRWFFQQLIIGLDYCHRRGVVNRDIKLENTLLQVHRQFAREQLRLVIKQQQCQQWRRLGCWQAWRGAACRIACRSLMWACAMAGHWTGYNLDMQRR
jgi:hypothetical protein